MGPERSFYCIHLRLCTSASLYYAIRKPALQANAHTLLTHGTKVRYGRNSCQLSAILSRLLSKMENMTSYLIATRLQRRL